MRVPTATYRLQLHRGFGLRDALALVPHLDALGVSDLYLSPLTRARSGSPHGYDVTDPRVLNPELGTAEDLRALSSALRGRGMGLLLDIVPNHMAIGPENVFWMDVLEHGPSSPWARVFDIDWYEDELSGAKVLLPCLGRPYGTALEDGELALRLEGGAIVVAYFDWRFPVDVSTWRPILEAVRARAADRGAIDRLLELVASLPPRSDPDPGAPERRRAARAEVLRRLAPHRAALEAALASLNGTPGSPRSFDALDRLLGEQAYRPAYWKVATETVEYRRFFDISDLVGVRVEDPAVFELVHELVLRLVDEGVVTGLRIDHVDGLHDPAGYLERLRERAPGAYVVVEKILARGETLPGDWACAGTTGYELGALAGELLVEPMGVETLVAAYRAFTGTSTSFAEVVLREKRRLLREEHGDAVGGPLFSGELATLARDLARLARRDRHARHVLRRTWLAALAEVTAALPVYRTYAREGAISEADRRVVDGALAIVERREPPFPPRVTDFLRRVLRMELPDGAPEAERGAWTRFVMRWQQLTGPVMAKGYEDTALYAHAPLLSLNEVGGAGPDVPVDPVAAAHRFLRERAGSGAPGLSATSTHDSKRSEDVRARLAVLSEMPAEWELHLRSWSRWNRRHGRTVGGVRVPDAHEETFFFQSLLGVWPMEPADAGELAQRVRESTRKAARESKVHTSWLHPHPEHEEALLGWVDAVLDPGNDRFRADFEPFARRVARLGAVNGLAQVVLKAWAPGVPDFYQGTEGWFLRLVDPDNRRPVDWGGARHALAALRVDEHARSDLLFSWHDGRIKLLVTARALAARRAAPELFTRGAYLPVPVRGAQRAHAFAFARSLDGAWALAVIPRLPAGLGEGFAMGSPAWDGTSLALPRGAPSRWRSAIDGRPVGSARLPDVLAHWPVEMLVSDEGK